MSKEINELAENTNRVEVYEAGAALAKEIYTPGSILNLYWQRQCERLSRELAENLYD